MSTFTWASSEGREFEVEAILDIDQWTGREMRAIERIGGGQIGGVGFYGTLSYGIAVSVARVVPGYTIDTVDAELTFGRVRAIHRQMVERDEAAAAAAAAEQEQDDAAAGEGVVLSPTKPGEQDDTPQ